MAKNKPGRIDLKTGDKLWNCWTVDRLSRTWEMAGHQVVLLTLKRDSDGYLSPTLLCPCDLDESPDRPNADACPVKAAFRQLAKSEAISRHGPRWLKMSPTDILEDVWTRHKAGEYFGQHHPEIIYLQEVCEVTGHPQEVLLKAVEELFAAEKLDLNGMILCDFVAGFRFPVELERIIRYVTEEPIGWPNGEAGECFVVELERAVTDGCPWKSAKEAFPYDWPHLQPHIREMFALAWLRSVIEERRGNQRALAALKAQLRSLIAEIDGQAPPSS